MLALRRFSEVERGMKRTIGCVAGALFLSITLHSVQPTHTLVDVRTVAPTIRIDIRYATSNNFLKKIIYTDWKGSCYLQRPVAEKLARVQKDLEKQNLGLLIWDAYRPLSAQWTMWNAKPDPRYVSDPRKGGRHTRGATVDCTLVNLKTGKLLSMPTEFDDFTPRAWSACDDLLPEAKHNRQTLVDAMKKHGFLPLTHEWWHFDSADYRDYDPLDISFAQLCKKGEYDEAKSSTSSRSVVYRSIGNNGNKRPWTS